MLQRVRLWIRSLVLRQRLEREMQEEMAGHIEQAAARLMGRGLSAQEARHQAMREFGNVVYLQEQGRDARGTAWLDALRADFRFALRQFARKPGTTITMLVVLAAGMSISTLLFSWVHSYAVQAPTGIARADDLVRIRGSRSERGAGRVARALPEEEFLAYTQLHDHFAAVAGWRVDPVVLDAGDSPERRGLEARATFVTDGYFQVLGVQPMLGPGLPEQSADATVPVALIGYNAWVELFGRDQSVIGSHVMVNGVSVTVVGVAPERFGINGFNRLQLWLPLSARRVLLTEPLDEFRAAARLRPGVSLRAATAAVQVVVARTTEDTEATRAARPSADVVPLLSANGDPNFDNDVRLMYFWFGLLGLLVLLITCTNVSALLTGLASARRQEIAVRLSLGAGRRRLIRQLLTESALLACIAGAAALGLVSVVIRIVTLRVPDLPFEVNITWQATAFTFGMALAVGILFGLSPALHATRLALAGVLRDSTAMIAATRGRLQRGLVIAQIALTQPLIVLLAAVFMIVLNVYQPRVRNVDADRIVGTSIMVAASSGVGTTAAEARLRMQATMSQLHNRLENAPGVETVIKVWGGTSQLGSFIVHADDRIGNTAPGPMQLSGERVSGGYFRMLGIPFVRGRDFTPADFTGQHATGDVPIIVDTRLAELLWARHDPVGRRLQETSDSVATRRTFVVVGVIDDGIRQRRSSRENYHVFLPPDTTERAPGLLLRTTGPGAVIIPMLRRAMQEEAPDLVVGLRTLADIQEEHTRNFRMLASGVSTAGMLSLLLSAIGLYAVVAFSVGQRTREIAVRFAVGGSREQIVQKFVRDGLRLSGIGLAIGLPASLIGLRVLMTFPDIPPVPLTPVTAIATFGVLSVAVAAAWIPARRAASVDPAITLRSD